MTELEGKEPIDSASSLKGIKFTFHTLNQNTKMTSSVIILMQFSKNFYNTENINNDRPRSFCCVERLSHSVFWCFN